MLKSPALTPSPNILKNYTGWFTDSNGQRLATTLDGANLRLGCLDHIHGDILESWLLSFSQLPALNIGGSSKEETALDHPFQAHAKAFPGGHTVSFDIKMGTVHGMTIDKVFYARDEPDKCIILSVPTEIRQMIWRHSVHSGASKLTLLQRGDRRIITDDMHTELNRIHEVHPAFATEALHLELCDPNTTLECTDAGHLVELLHSDKGNVKLSLCHVVLWTDWGQKPLLMPESHEQQHLYYILRYAAANKKGVREAIRGKRPANTIVTVDGIVEAWRNGSSVDVLDVDNVRFFPNEDFSRESFFRLKVSLAVQKTSAFYLALAAYAAADQHEAVELLVKDVESWYRNGI